MKTVFWGVFVFGVLLCSTLGIGKTLERAGGSWLSPAMLGGIVLGLALIALAVSFGTGVRPAFLKTDMAMLVALGVLMSAKVGISVVHAALVAAR